jgi:putative transposase
MPEVDKMENRYLGHTTYRTEYHISWLTKYRRPVLNTTRKEYLSKWFPIILAMFPGSEIMEYNILPDHVHIVMVIPPKYSVSEVVGRLKGIASSHLRNRFPKLAEVYRKDKSVWSPGYFVSTVGVSEKKIIEYVRNQ